jgi:hypothetical protein
MPQNYATYTEISVNALKFNPKSKEVIDRKQEILKSIANHYTAIPSSTLFYGFSPLMLASTSNQLAVTHIKEDTKKYLDGLGIKYTYIDPDDLDNYKKKFDWVVAGEEYFTFADSEEEQRLAVELLSKLAKKLIVTTLRDYKNQDFKEREFSQPLAVRNGKESKLFLEYHDHDYDEKNAWETTVWELSETDTKQYGPFNRRSMFFKQLAKFCLDAGATNFYVHKNLMYKSLIKKNYEHVISISF